jgi:hypothetical protein
MKIIFGFLVCLFSIFDLYAPDEKWEVVGSKEIGFKADYDVIVLTAGQDRFRRIKFQVKGSAVDMIKIEITYDTGSAEEVEMRGKIADGGESRTIDIKGVKKKIRKITFWYDTKGFSGNATVTILGVN